MFLHVQKFFDIHNFYKAWMAMRSPFIAPGGFHYYAQDL